MRFPGLNLLNLAPRSHIGGTFGTVDAMTIVSTTLMTLDNQKVVAPNNMIWGDKITNVTGTDKRRVDMVFGIGYSDNIAKAQKIFVKALEKAKLRQIRIHDLRHTYATLRISKGDNIADVSNQLGHFSEIFAMKAYYHWIPGKKKAEVDELDDREFRDKNRAYDEAEQAV